MALRVGVSDRQLLLQTDALASSKVMEERMSQRTFKGLDPSIGETKAELASIGLSGIPREYK
jgi:hypothetical protein